MTSVISRLADLLADAGMFLVALVAGLIVYDVVMRLWFGMPFAGTADLVAVSLVLVTFLQAPKALLENRLLQVTGLLKRWPARLTKFAMAAGNLLGMALFLALAVISLGPIGNALSMHEFFGSDAFRIPAAPIRIVTTALWAVFALCFLAKALRHINGDNADD